MPFPDSPEGQTHHVGDGCNPAHNGICPVCKGTMILECDGVEATCSMCRDWLDLTDVTGQASAYASGFREGRRTTLAELLVMADEGKYEDLRREVQEKLDALEPT